MKAREQRYIMMPIVPIIQSGELVVRISAYGPMKIDTEEVTITVRVRFLPSYHHYIYISIIF
jgi:hypothetical protein